MRANIRRIKKVRRFSEDYKRKIVKEYEQGCFTVLELSKLHHVHFQTIYNWIYKYSSFNKKSIQIVEMKESSTQKIKELELKIKELEQVVGQKQLYIDYLEKMIEIAKGDFGLDIKKNYNTPQSTGSKKTKKR